MNASYVNSTSTEDGTLFHILFAVIDIEATGGNPLYERIIEITGFLMRGNQIEKHYHTLVNPEKPIPPFITKLTGITNEMVAGKPTIKEIIAELLEFLEGAIIVAHNASFDTQLLGLACNEHLNKQIRNGVLCTRKLARRIFPWLPGYNLGTIATFLGFDVRDRHRAYGDALATARILSRMLSYLDHLGIRNLEQLYMIEGGKFSIH